MGTGERFPLSFHRRPNEMVHVASTEDLASPDVPELVLSLSKPVVEVPISGLNTLIQKADFVKRRTPDHHTGAVEPIKYGL